MHRVKLIILLTIVAVSFGSCSKSQIPVSPDISTPDIHSINQVGNHRTIWGLWDVYIDPENETLEIVPLRALNFQANVVNHLQPPQSPIHMLTINIDAGTSDFPSGLVNVDVTLNHPFPGSIFCGFDVMGIVMDDHDGVPWATDPSIISSIQPNTLLQNPDGWTRWWNQVEFTTYGTLLGYIEGARANPNFTSTHTLNAFKYFCDGLSAEDDFFVNINNRGFFSSYNNANNKRRYELQFQVEDSSPVFNFKYAVSASWAQPYEDIENPNLPQHFPISANMPEAYKLDVIDTGCSAWFFDQSHYGGDLDLKLDIYDWQLYGMSIAATEEIESIKIESPTLFQGPIYLDPANGYMVPVNVTRRRYDINIPDVTPSGLNNQLLLVTVNSVHPATYEPQIPGISGIDYPEGHLAAYYIYDVPIKVNYAWDHINLGHPHDIWMTNGIFDQDDNPIVAVSSADGGAMYHFYAWNGIDWDHDTPFGYGDTGAHCSIRMCFDPDWNLAAVWPNIHWNGANRDSVINIRDHISLDWNYSEIDTSYCGGYFNVIDHDGTNYGVSFNIDDDTLWFAYGQPGDWEKEAVGPLVGDNCMDFAFDSFGNPYIVSTEPWAVNNLTVWYNTTGTWQMHVIYASPVTCPRISAGLSGEMYVTYYDDPGLKFSHGSELNWMTSTIVPGAAIGSINFLDELDIRTDSHGQPHIAYKDNHDDGVSYIYRDEGGWHDQFVAPSFDRAKIALALDSMDRPLIVYLGPDGLNDLRVAWGHW